MLPAGVTSENANLALLELFQSDADIDQFWRLGEAERRARWGQQLDLQALSVMRHTLEPEPGPLAINL
jgi:hypothetical protein